MNKNINCKICNYKINNKKFVAQDFDGTSSYYSIYKCSNCGFGFVFPYPSPTIINSFYDQGYYGNKNKKFVFLFEQLTILGNKLRARKIKSIYLKKNDKSSHRKNRILDIGCGRGTLLKILSQIGFECYGLEREKFICEKDIIEFKFIRQDLLNSKFVNGYFNCIIMWHVLEHMDHDPNRIIDELNRILSSNGLLIISVPNFSSLQSLLFGKNWFHLDLPRHKYHFSKKSIKLLLKNRGFEIIKLTTFSFEQSLFGFIQSLLNKILFFTSDNQLYQLLKNNNKSFAQMNELFVYSLIALIIFPIAFIEYLFSGICQKGAVLTCYAKKIN